ncbi:hypothetical protein [Pseudolysinimonas sp.]|uniref:hypothetical protein n=1 Tax=Pseudolysinimonas sp. TaxID=2680009 RepID=UPI0032635324
MKSVSVALEEIGGIFKVTPDVNAGTNEGFTPLIEHRVETHFDTPEELGQAILEAFTKAR